MTYKCKRNFALALDKMQKRLEKLNDPNAHDLFFRYSSQGMEAIAELGLNIYAFFSLVDTKNDQWLQTETALFNELICITLAIILVLPSVIFIPFSVTGDILEGLDRGVNKCVYANHNSTFAYPIQNATIDDGLKK